MATNDALRLLFIVEHFRDLPSGAERDAVAVCRALAARGFDVHVAADTADEIPGITIHRGLDRLEEHLRDARPDLTVDWALLHPADVHRLGGGTHAGFLPFALQAYSGPARLLKWLGQRLSLKHRTVIRRENKLLRNPQAHFLAISGLVARQAVAGGAAPEQVEVLHNSVDTKRLAPERCAELRKVARLKLGLKDGDILCLFIAHNLILKNLRLLRDVFSRLHPEHPQLKLVVVGKRAPGFRAPWLIHIPPTSRLEELYAAGDLLLHPSYFDSFANVVLEAMACGLPVVVSDCCGVAELVESGVNGFVMPVRGPRASTAGEWAGLLVWLAGDPELRKRLGAAARQSALEHDFDRFADCLAAILRQRAESVRNRIPKT